MRYIRKDGTLRWGEVTVSIIRGENGSPKYRLTQVVDISERMQRDERLQVFETVVEGLEEMIAVVDRDYHYAIANRAYLKYRGLQFEQLREHLFPYPLDQQAFESIVKIKFAECLKGKALAFETRYKYPELGERDLFLSYSPIKGPKGIDGVALVMRDVTDRKHAEEGDEETRRVVWQICETRSAGELQEVYTTCTGQNLAVLESNLIMLQNALPPSARKLRKLAQSCERLVQECTQRLGHSPICRTRRCWTRRASRCDRSFRGRIHGADGHPRES